VTTFGVDRLIQAMACTPASASPGFQSAGLHFVALSEVLPAYARG
jgi:hypothetical protein